jgi:hypothetical protein
LLLFKSSTADKFGAGVSRFRNSENPIRIPRGHRYTEVVNECLVIRGQNEDYARLFMAVACWRQLACASFPAGMDVNTGQRTFLTGNHETALACFQSAAAKDPNYIHSPIFCAIAIPARIPNHPHISTIAKVRKASPKSTGVTVPVGAINTRSRTFHRPLTETMSPPVIKPPSSPTAQTIPCINVKKNWFIASLM